MSIPPHFATTDQSQTDGSATRDDRGHVDRWLIPDLIKVTEIFLIPSSFLVAALGTADTNIHRAAVSLLGLVVSWLWWICSREAMDDWKASVADRDTMQSRRIRILFWLPLFFVGSWIVSLIIHAMLWNRPLGVD